MEELSPLAPIPHPPRPQGRAGRKRQRFRRAVRLRDEAERIRIAINMIQTSAVHRWTDENECTTERVQASNTSAQHQA